MSVFQCATPGRIFLVDVHVLGPAAFDAISGLSFKAILESKKVLKVGFDLRNMADALYRHYNVHLNNIIDLQCLQMLSAPTAPYLTGFVKTLRMSGTVTGARWDEHKEAHNLLLDEMKAKDFTERPMTSDLQLICHMDIWYFPDLYNRLSRQRSKPEIYEVQRLSQQRLACCFDDWYDPQGANLKMNTVTFPKWMLNHRNRMSASLKFGDGGGGVSSKRPDHRMEICRAPV